MSAKPEVAAAYLVDAKSPRLARRRPEAVRELEIMQQEVRAEAGEPAILPEQLKELLLDDVKQRLISQAHAAGGLDAAIEAAGEIEEKAEAEAERLIRTWRIDEPEQWSRYETPASRWAIARTCVRVEEVFTRHGWPLPEVPVVGTLTTGYVSALTQRTASGAPIILIDNGFFKFTGTVGQLAFMSAAELLEDYAWRQATLQLMSDVAATMAVLKTCLYLYSRPMPEEMAEVVNNYQDAMMLFAIGHEYAHISEGHLDAHPRSGPASGTSLRDREFAADRIGLMVANKSLDPRNRAGVFGSFLYLCGLDLVARVEAAYKGEVPKIETNSPTEYPTPYERTVALLDWIGEREELAAARPAAHAASKRYNEILFVWDRIHPVFRALREELRQYDPAVIGKAAVLQEAVTFGLVRTLWHAVKAAHA